MPTVAVVAGIAIVMYYNDHLPPHFHAKQAGVEFRVRISDLKLMRGDMAPTALEQTVRRLGCPTSTRTSCVLGTRPKRSGARKDLNPMKLHKIKRAAPDDSAAYNLKMWIEFER